MVILFKIIAALFITGGIGFAGLIGFAIILDNSGEGAAISFGISLFLLWIFIMFTIFAKKIKIGKDRRTTNQEL